MLMKFRINEADTDDHRFIHNTETLLLYERVPQFTGEESTTFAGGLVNLKPGTR